MSMCRSGKIQRRDPLKDHMNYVVLIMANITSTMRLPYMMTTRFYQNADYVRTQPSQHFMKFEIKVQLHKF